MNADQTVVVVWDPATKTEHFVRRASFKAEAHDFGFLIPSPSKPDLAESGDVAFDTLAKLTAPEIKYESLPSSGCSGCLFRSKSMSASAAAPFEVKVLEEKTVAGFDASVLEATSSTALVGWLKEHGYAFSPEVEAWAKPYVEQGWKITALRVAKEGPDAGASAAPSTIAAASLRLSFKTDRPLFPYREPDNAKDAPKLDATIRMLRIFFVSTERYDGTLTKDTPFGGGKIQPSRPAGPPAGDKNEQDQRFKRWSDVGTIPAPSIGREPKPMNRTLVTLSALSALLLLAVAGYA